MNCSRIYFFPTAVVQINIKHLVLPIYYNTTVTILCGLEVPYNTNKDIRENYPCNTVNVNVFERTKMYLKGQNTLQFRQYTLNCKGIFSSRIHCILILYDVMRKMQGTKI